MSRSSKDAQSQEAVSRLLVFTESTIDILNSYVKNPPLFKELVQFKTNWLGMGSTIKTF